MARTTTAALWPAVLIALSQMTLCPLSGQGDSTEANLRGGPEKNTLLYQGPLVHDERWVMKSGTTNNNVLGVFGGNCSLIASDVKNVRGSEVVRLEAEHEGLGVWKVTHIDTVIGTAVADRGQRYTYTYVLRRSVRGISTDGKPPSPNRAMPTPNNNGFLEPIPNNIESAALKFEDFFLLREESTGRVVADAQVLGWFHRRINPSEQPPASFPFVLDGYIVTRIETLAGQAGCDPL